MCSQRDSAILALLDRLKEDIRLARTYALDHTARLLQIATLDLQTILHAITDDELRQFTEIVEDSSDADSALNC